MILFILYFDVMVMCVICCFIIYVDRLNINEWCGEFGEKKKNGINKRLKLRAVNGKRFICVCEWINK